MLSVWIEIKTSFHFSYKLQHFILLFTSKIVRNTMKSLHIHPMKGAALAGIVMTELFIYMTFVLR